MFAFESMQMAFWRYFTDFFLYFVLLYSIYGVSAEKFRVCGRTNHNSSTGELLPHSGIIPPGHTCIWHIYPESYTMPEVFMVVKEFDLSDNDNFIINKHDGALLFGPFKGKKELFSLLSGDLLLDVIVRTAASPSTFRNFTSDYTAKGCFYEINDLSGSMSSPLYNDKKREYNITCSWKFRKYKDISHLVTFKTFHLLNSTLTVEGSEAQDGTYTGTKLPPNIIASDDTVISLHLNTSIPGESFSFDYNIEGNQDIPTTVSISETTEYTTSLIYNSAKGLCGQYIHSELKGTLSPQGGVINALENCIWQINTEPNAIKSKELYIFVEEFLLADNDKFTITDENDNNIFGPYSGKKGPFIIITGKVNRVKVKLEISDDYLLWKRTFKAGYNAINCSYQITNEVGIINTPVYDFSSRRPDLRNIMCNWIFDVSNEMRVISFDKYYLKNGNITFTGDVVPYKFYSGNQPPPDVFIKKGSLSINFDTFQPNETIAFTYAPVTSECSLYIKLTEQMYYASISSPSFQGNDWIHCQWIVESPPSTIIAIEIDSLNLKDKQDSFIIADGNSRDSPVLLDMNSNNRKELKENYIISSKNKVWISFSTHFLLKGSKLEAKVNISKQGGYLKDEGKFTVKGVATGKDIMYFLEVEKGKQVLLTCPNVTLPFKGIIQVFNGFSISASLLTILTYNQPIYPIASTGSKMMIVGKNFDEKSSVDLSFKGIDKGCYQVTLDQIGNYILSGNCNKTCSWTIPPNLNSKDTLSFHLSVIDGNSDGKIEIFQLDEKMTFITSVGSEENRISNLYLPAVSGAYISVTRKSCSSENSNSAFFSANFESIRNCSVEIEVKSDEVIHISSPNYPDNYPFLSNCWTNVSTDKDNFLYLSFKKFHLADSHCLNVHEVNDNKIITITTFKNSVLPEDLILKSNFALELVGKSCSLKKTDSHPYNAIGYFADVFSISCGGLFDKKLDGSFSIPNSLNQKLCIWKIKIPKNFSDSSINIIAFTVKWTEDSADKHIGLEIHDGPSLYSNVLNNVTTTEMLSRTNTLVFIYHNIKSESHSGVTIHYETRACSSLCDNRICMHPDWLCNGINECLDYSDEKNCKGHNPIPPPVPPNVIVTKTGVTPLAIGLAVPGAFLFGIGITILSAFLFSQYRNRRENTYHNFPIYSDE